MFGEELTGIFAEDSYMAGSGTTDDTEVPWPQQLLDSEWLLALAAVLFFTLSYIVLGLVDLLSVPSG